MDAHDTQPRVVRPGPDAALPAMITALKQRVRALDEDGATLYAWSKGGVGYARANADELDLSDGFVAFLTKPERFMDDLCVELWYSMAQFHSGRATWRTLYELRALVSVHR